MYVAVMLFVPAVLNVVFSVAVAPARMKFVCEPPDDVTFTGLPMAVPPLKNVTVPVGPAALKLEVVTVALSAT